MPNETVTALSVSQVLVWCNKTLLSIIAMSALATLARTLVSDEPFDLRRCLGELIFSIIGAVLMYTMGLMQGMTDVQIIFFGALGSLGGVRLVEWAMGIAQKIRQAGILND
jgi:hypothetical protein